MILGVLAETCPGEERVALIPANVIQLKKRQVEILIEAGAGIAAAKSTGSPPAR